MREEEHFWPAWDSDGTAGEQPTVRAASPRAPYDQPTVSVPVPAETLRARPQSVGGYPDEPTVIGVRPVGPPAGDPYGSSAFATETFDDPTEPELPKGKKLRTGLGKAMMVTGGVLGLLVIIYGVDLVLSLGDVPRGVTVAGVDVGGLSRTDAESKLRDELQPRFEQPVTVQAGDVQAELNPAEAGLGIDWQRTLEQAGSQPLSPITRVSSFFTSREVGIVGTSDQQKLDSALSRLAASKLNHKKTEGTIKFEPVPGEAGKVQAIAVEPKQGQRLQSADIAADLIKDNWLSAGGVELPVHTQPVSATSEGVHATLDTLVKPAIGAPITVNGDGVTATLTPADIAEAFKFTAKDDGSLDAKVRQEKLKAALQPQLAGTEREGRDAEIVFEGGQPTVQPASYGRKINWVKSFKPYEDVIKKSDGRVLTAVYEKKKPKVTTEEAKGLGIKEVIGEFTTGGFKPDSGVNIRMVAAEVNGAIVKPGDTFSLNGYTGPRTAAQGYVDAGIIQDGIPGRAVGGGISQFATTLFNASYFAGLKDAGHREHSYYISRYPMAREATVFQSAGGGIDIAFTNDSPNGVAIQTFWSPSSVTVKIWGTKRYNVKSVTGPKTNIRKPTTRKVSSEDCEPSDGIDGFTATDTRILYDVGSGAEVRREPRTAVYNPKPKIVCDRKDED